MVRLAITFFAMVVTARWIYSEVQMSFPRAVPAIDYALEKVQIPTHDKWDREKISEVVQTVAAHIGGADSSAERLSAPRLERVTRRLND